MTALEIALAVYRIFIAKNGDDGIPVFLTEKLSIGTVQDDPFDRWVEEELKKCLPRNFEVFHSGVLTTPDLIIRDKKSGTVVGFEIKKLIRKGNGSDSRGMTIDYNSCLPCGSAIVKISDETIIIPCYYFFALLDKNSKNIVTLIVMDGDFLNYDFNLHKESKYSNYTEYNHGPYAEGSIRHRKMYTYPNPLNAKIAAFHLRQILIAKKSDFEKINENELITEKILRKDRYGNCFYYYLKDESSREFSETCILKNISDIFKSCKQRQPKQRTVAIPVIPPINIANVADR